MRGRYPSKGPSSGPVGSLSKLSETTKVFLFRVHVTSKVTFTCGRCTTCSAFGICNASVGVRKKASLSSGRDVWSASRIKFVTEIRETFVTSALIWAAGKEGDALLQFCHLPVSRETWHPSKFAEGGGRPRANFRFELKTLLMRKVPFALATVFTTRVFLRGEF